MTVLEVGDVESAAARISGVTRPVSLIRGSLGQSEVELWWAAEFLQHTGSFKARGAVNLVAANMAAGSMPEEGVVIASGGNAGLACAWAARRYGVAATVFLPESAPPVKLERLRGYGAKVVLAGRHYYDALAASVHFAAQTGALLSHAYDHPLIAAGAGTLMTEILAALPTGLDTVVAVGGGGLFAGLATIAGAHGIRVVAVEPRGCQALTAALRVGTPVDVEVDSVAADSLGARRATPLALAAAARAEVRAVVVDDDAIVAARRHLWEDYRLVVEHAAGTALAALHTSAYRPAPGERLAVILCGSNTDPSDLVA